MNYIEKLFLRKIFMYKDLFKNYNHLGFFNPFYYFNNQNLINATSDFKKILNEFPYTVRFDKMAIAEVLSNRFILGDRTIIEEISRSPWLAKPNQGNTGWEYYNLKKHQENKQTEEIVANNLFILLCDEIKNYIGNKKTVGILLSGGMDSRIVAGCLDYLIKNKEIEIKHVTAYNWGNPNSRDVVYAKKIAERLGWNYMHYTVSSDDLWENFKIAGVRGAEYSGIHLHAIPQIKKYISEEVLLVGSYGDSIGRGEYEGVKVAKLEKIKSRLNNFGSFLNTRCYNQIKKQWERDIEIYHNLFPQDKNYQQFELDFQLHYMRRMLNPCMEILNEVVPTYQIFTSPEVFEYMWSLHPEVRTDKVYAFIMQLFTTKLNDIPWARTGVVYLGHGKPDNYTKKHHDYYESIQNDLMTRIEEQVFADRIGQLGVFNMASIKKTIQLIKLFKGNKNNDYLERLTWFVSLDYFIQESENIEGMKYKTSLEDYINSFVKNPLKYLMLQFYRTLK